MDVLNKQGLAELFREFKREFQLAFDAFGEKNEWQRLATMIRSNGESNLYPFFKHWPKLKKWLGDREIKNLELADYRLANEIYESTVEVDKPAVERDQAGIFLPAFSGEGRAAAEWPDDVVFDALVNAASRACYDGQNFLDTDHPWGKGVVASNYDAAGGGDLWMLLDTSKPMMPFIYQRELAPKMTSMTKPDSENVFRQNKFLFGIEARGVGGYGFWQLAYGSLNTLNATNYGLYRTAMRQLKTPEGYSMGVSPDLLVCGPSNQTAAEALLDRQILASGESNVNYKKVKLLVTNELP